MLSIHAHSLSDKHEGHSFSLFTLLQAKKNFYEIRKSVASDLFARHLNLL